MDTALVNTAACGCQVSGDQLAHSDTWPAPGDQEAVWTMIDLTRELPPRAAHLGLPSQVGHRNQNVSAFARKAMRCWLGVLTETKPSSVEFKRERCPRCSGPQGRPALVGDQGLHFSISTSGSTVALAVARSSVGIDVQRLQPGTPSVVRSLHPVEASQLDLPTGRGGNLARCWTRKEAVLKATGTGIGHGVSQPLVGAGPVPIPVPGYVLHDLPAAAGYSAAIAHGCPLTSRSSGP